MRKKNKKVDEWKADEEKADVEMSGRKRRGQTWIYI